jgi:hypothetical protein
MKRRLTLGVSVLFAAALEPCTLSAQTSALGARIDAVRAGRVRMTFAAQPGVCGNGMSWFRVRGGSINGTVINGNWSGGRDVEASCEHGPVRVVVVRADGETTDVRAYVGGTWKADTGVTDLGAVAAVEAGRWLLNLAEHGPAKPARAAMTAATLADSVDAAKALLRIARDDQRPTDIRSSALAWLGETVGEQMAMTLDSIAYEPGDREVRKQAIFALSRRPADEAVPALLKMVETLPDRELRKTAVFWLVQSKDPRAVAWVEKRLTR